MGEGKGWMSEGWEGGYHHLAPPSPPALLQYSILLKWSELLSANSPNLSLIELTARVDWPPDN